VPPMRCGKSVTTSPNPRKGKSFNLKFLAALSLSRALALVYFLIRDHTSIVVAPPHTYSRETS